jgi:hypothetical protein
MATGPSIDLVPVTSRRLLRAFIDLPHRLYRDEPAYVPRLFVQQKEQLSRRNPYFRHSDAGYLLARRGGEFLGRIAWFLNAQHLRFSGRRELLFGCFDAVDDPAVSEALLGAVHGQARALACTAVLGPIEFSTNDTCGLLIDGFDRPPALLMPFQAPHHAALLAHAGYQTVQELHAYEIRGADRPPFLEALAGRLEARLAPRGIAVRAMDFSRFQAEVEALYPIYEAIFSGNWGFMPLSRAEFLHMAAGLRQVSAPDFALVAERNGAPIGYAVGVFDANEVFASFRRGRLLPFNFFRLGRIRKVKRLKILNLGVVPAFQNLGLDLLMATRLFEAGLRRGMDAAEASYVMGSNLRMQRAILRLNGRLTKRYAIFRKELP